MIENAAQLDQARRVLAGIEESLHALRDRVASANPELFRAMAGDYVDDITRIRAEIDTYIGTAEASLERAPLWLVLEGAGVDLADTGVSSRTLAEWLGRFRKSVLGVTEYLKTGRVRRQGRPSAALINATDVRLVALAPGSVKVGLRVPPDYVQGNAFDVGIRPEDTSPRRAIERLLEMAIWAQSGDLEPPLATFPDTDEAALVAAQLLELIPPIRGSVRVVGFEGSLVPSHETVRLRGTAHSRVSGLVQLLSVTSEAVATGTIREIDLDAQRIILRERGPGDPDLKCYLPEDLVALAESLLDHEVQVRGLVSSASPDRMEVISLSPVRR